jgi:hypothetical protein
MAAHGVLRRRIGNDPRLAHGVARRGARDDPFTRPHGVSGSRVRDHPGLAADRVMRSRRRQKDASSRDAALLQSENLRAANHTAEGQQPLRHRHLDRLHEALPAHYAMPARGRLHCRFGIHTYHALKPRNKFNPLKPSGDYMYHLFYQPVTLHLVSCMILSVKSDRFLTL